LNPGREGGLVGPKKDPHKKRGAARGAKGIGRKEGGGAQAP